MRPNANGSLLPPLAWLVLAALLSVAPSAFAQRTSVNTWAPAHESRGGTIAGITYLPDQQSLLYFGYPAPKSTPSDLRLYHPAKREWTEPLPGRGPHQARGSFTTAFAADQRPGLPTVNRPYWLAHQSVYVPPLKKVLFFAGGRTFTYDPEAARWGHLDIPLDQSPPDVMLGSMAWDAVGKRVIFFGGGYISAYKAAAAKPKSPPAHGKPWMPADWTMAEKRATWAFDPATLAWSRVITGSESFRDHHGTGNEFVMKIETLAGSARGIALEYGDRISGKSPEHLAADAQKLAAEFSTYAERLNRGDGCGDAYERQQCKAAASRLNEVNAGLAQASRALTEKDGWKALHALEAARQTAVEASEDLAPSPLPRYYGNLVADTRNKLLVLFGGHGGDRALADTWVFDSARSQWRQSSAKGHPPPTLSPAMSFDAEHGVVLLSSGWIYDAGADEWRRMPLAATKDFFLPWTALAYDAGNRMHIALTTGDNLFEPGALRIAHLRLDVNAAKPADYTGPRWVWLNDKYRRSWEALPRTQAEYRSRVAANKTTLAQMPPNSWTRINTVYNAQDRSYGSFAQDPVRGQLVLWGGGHSAYMGNEVSQYDIKGNLWMESWPPDMPPWPFGSPDGDGWNPPLYHRKAASHGYHGYAFSAEMDRILLGGLAYDSDRMRWSDTVVRKSGDGALGSAVDMSGANAFYTVSAKHWYGGPFGVWRLNKATGEFARLPRSDSPFTTNDRAKPVFDSKRNRILFYGVRDDKANAANQLYSFDIVSGTWTKQAFTLESPEAQAPGSMSWGVALQCETRCTRDFCREARSRATWLLDLATNRLRRLGPGPFNPQPRHQRASSITLNTTVSSHLNSGATAPARSRYTCCGWSKGAASAAKRILDGTSEHREELSYVHHSGYRTWLGRAWRVPFSLQRHV